MTTTTPQLPPKGPSAPQQGGDLLPHGKDLTTPKDIPMFDKAIALGALVESFRKLDPRVQVRNPVMFVVWVGGIVTIILWLHALLTAAGEAAPGFILAVSVWLWLT